MNKMLLVIYFFSLGSGVIYDQDVSDYEKGKHIDKYGNELLIRTLYPKSFDKQEQYPLVLFLHGAGERGMDNEKQLIHGSTLFLDSMNREKFNGIVVFPQCDENDYWANVKRTRDSNNQRVFDFKKKGRPTSSMTLVLSLVDSLRSLPFVDENRIYVAGLSMGGMGTFELLKRRPEVFAAAIPICGGDHPKSAKKYAKKVPLWVFHGAKDDVVLPRYSKQVVDAIQAKGGTVKYTIYPNANHNCWDPAFSEAELLPWLFSQSKNN